MSNSKQQDNTIDLKSENLNIRIDCYLVVKKKFEKQYPNAHFEVITRTSNSILSPSWELLKKIKREKWSFQEYKIKLLEELSLNPKVIPKLEEMRKIAEKKTLFLVCYEKDPSQCHRSIIKKLIENSEVK